MSVTEEASALPVELKRMIYIHYLRKLRRRLQCVMNMYPKQLCDRELCALIFGDEMAGAVTCFPRRQQAQTVVRRVFAARNKRQARKLAKTMRLLELVKIRGTHCCNDLYKQALWKTSLRERCLLH